MVLAEVASVECGAACQSSTVRSGFMSVATAAEPETGTGPRPSECPCQDRRDLGPRPCFLEVSSPEFLSWREAAIRRLLEVEVEPLTREGELRLDPFTRIGLDNDLDDLEEAAVHASLATGVALPEAQARVWVPRYWRARGPHLTRRLVVDAEDRGSAAAVIEALRGPLLRYLAWQATHDPGELEAWLLAMEERCDRRHLAALRRAAVREARAQRTQERARAGRADHGELAVGEGVSPDVALPLALAALAAFVQANADRIWRGRHDRRVRRRSEAGWIGRWDAPDQAVAIDCEVVRAVLGRFGDPEALLRLMDQRGLIKGCGSSARDRRWQRRVGERGTRMSCVGIVPAVVTGVTQPRGAT